MDMNQQISKCKTCDYLIISKEWNFCPNCSRKISNKVKTHIRLICDRQDLIDTAKMRQLGLESFMIDRKDMYWIEVELPTSKKSITFSVDPSYYSGKITWGLTRQYGERSEMAYEIAKKAFKGSEEEQNLLKWTQNLVDAGYFSKGCYGAPDTYKCKHCKGIYKNGTTHEHLRYEGRIIAHNLRQYNKIKELGLEPSWRPGSKKDEPSLEELREIDTEQS